MTCGRTWAYLRHADLRVAKDLHHDPLVDPLGEQERGRGMPCIVNLSLSYDSGRAAGLQVRGTAVATFHDGLLDLSAFAILVALLPPHLFIFLQCGQVGTVRRVRLRRCHWTGDGSIRCGCGRATSLVPAVDRLNDEDERNDRREQFGDHLPVTLVDE